MPSSQFLLQPQTQTPTASTTMQISHASDFVSHNMKGERAIAPNNIFSQSIFEMSTSLRPTVKFSDSERAPTYLIIITSCQVKNLGGKKVVFLSKLYRLTSLSASARAQTPVVMISVTDSGNYWTFLFMPRARSKLAHPHVRLSSYSFLFSLPLSNPHPADT